MADIRVIEGDFTECSGRYALVVGRFNGFVVESLVEGALDTLRRHGISDDDVTIDDDEDSVAHNQDCAHNQKL